MLGDALLFKSRLGHNPISSSALGQIERRVTALDELGYRFAKPELRNPDRAWEVARAMIREILKTEGVQNGLLNATLEVTDDEGEIVLEFPFTEAILEMPDQSVTRH